MLHLWLVDDVVLAGFVLKQSGDKLLHFFIDGSLIIDILLVSSRMSRCHGNTFHHCFWRFVAGKCDKRGPQCDTAPTPVYFKNILFSPILGIIASTVIILERRERKREREREREREGEKEKQGECHWQQIIQINRQTHMYMYMYVCVFWCMHGTYKKENGWFRTIW